MTGVQTCALPIYPVCIVHCDKHNLVENVEYFNGYYIGVDEKPVNIQQLLVYPNPSEGMITIEIPKGNSKTDNQIFIYNSFGSMVWRTKTSAYIISTDISHLAKGIYFVKLNNGDKIITKKIVLE